jgi:hypothetical protein
VEIGENVFGYQPSKDPVAMMRQYNSQNVFGYKPDPNAYQTRVKTDEAQREELPFFNSMALWQTLQLVGNPLEFTGDIITETFRHGTQGVNKAIDNLNRRARNSAEKMTYKGEALMKSSPMAYTVLGSAYKTGEDIGGFILDCSPARFFIGEYSDKFARMTPADQRWAIGVDTAFSMLFTAAGGAARKGAAIVAKRLVPMIEPIEDAISSIVKKGGTYQSFNTQSAVDFATKDFRLNIGGKAKGFSDKERQILSETVMSGDRSVLSMYEKEIADAGKNPSKVWLQTVIDDGKGGRRLSAELERTFNAEGLLASHKKFQYHENVKLLNKSRGMNLEIGDYDATLKHQMARFYDEFDASKVSFANITDEDMANVIKRMWTHTKETRKVRDVGSGRFWFPVLQPLSKLFGAMEIGYKTKSRVYDNALKMLEHKNEYIFTQNHMLLDMMSQRGFGKKVVDASGVASFKPNKTLYNKETTSAAVDILTEIDNLSMATSKEAKKKLANKIAEIEEFYGQPVTKDGAVPHLVMLYRQFNDHLYQDMLVTKTHSALLRSGLTKEGHQAVEHLISERANDLRRTFSSSGLSTLEELITAPEDRFLRPIRSRLNTFRGQHPWFQAQGEELEVLMRRLRKEFQIEDLMTLPNGKTANKGGVFPAYRLNYKARIAKNREEDILKWEADLTGAARPTPDPRTGGNARMRFGRTQQTQKREATADFGTLIEQRLSAQAYDLFVKPGLDDIVAAAKTMPQGARELTNELISRVLNPPSVWDKRLANFLDNLPVFKNKVTGEQATEAARFMNLSVYSGVLGARPYATMRELMTPLVTGMTDIGGISQSKHFTKGLTDFVSSKQMQQRVRRIDVYTDALPDQRMANLLPKFTTKEKVESVQNAALAFYSASDKFTRGWMASVALNKWDDVGKKLGSPIIGNEASMRKFSKELRLNLREPWKQAEIEQLIFEGKMKDAEQKYVQSVVEDTLFRYGPLDAPMIARGAGGVERSLTMFNSWWANYASLLGKWTRTGTTGKDVIDKSLGWIVASGSAGLAMRSMWGDDVALKNTGIGPLPLDRYSVPVVNAPVIRLGLTMLDAIHSEGAVKRLARDMFNFVPGGLMLNQLGAHVREGEAGWEAYVPGGTAVGGIASGARHGNWEKFAESLLHLHTRNK